MTNKNKRPIGFWGFILRLINFILIIALLISYFAQWISPDNFWPIAFFGIAYPVLALLNTFFVIHWIMRRRRFFIYSFVSLLLGVTLIGRFFQFGSNTEFIDISSPFKVLTYNVHVFDQYHSQYGGESYARDQIFDFLKEQNADIYCFQEFYHRDKNGMNNIDLLKKKLGTPYSYSAHYSPKSKYLYNVILSKKPIESADIIGKSENGKEISGIYADIKINNEYIRVYSVHLQSFQISSETAIFNFNYDIKTTEGQEEVKKNSIRMAKKFKIAFAARSKQIKALKTHISSSKYPVIIAGDFNDTPSSYAYGQLINEMDDAFKENGKGFGTTYNGPFPNFRIDYILYDPSLTSYKFDTWPIKFSDHYPISAVFSTK